MARMIERKGWEEYVILGEFKHNHTVAVTIEPRAEGFALVLRCGIEDCGQATKILQGDSNFLAHLVPVSLRKKLFNEGRMKQV